MPVVQPPDLAAGRVHHEDQALLGLVPVEGAGGVGPDGSHEAVGEPAALRPARGSTIKRGAGHVSQFTCGLTPG